jgi:NTP pyrophosphatase (non-canonical NTP hydrolase)
MTPEQYQAEFGRTRAPVFFPENVNPIFVGLLMRTRKSTADLVDAVKRALIYGNTDKLAKLGSKDTAVNELGLPYNVDVDELHAILGMEGEASEISEAVLSNDSPEVIRARIVDESGDFMWYMHLLWDKYGITMDEVLAGNIAKLAKRYPDKFTTDLAVNRNLEAEARVFQATNLSEWATSDTVITGSPINTDSIQATTLRISSPLSETTVAAIGETLH